MGREIVVHQLTPTLAWGDAIGNQVRLLKQRLQPLCSDTQIFAAQTDEASKGENLPPEALPGRVREGAVVVVHHSIQSRFVPLLRRVARRARVVVAYHNVTPPELFAAFDPPLARACAAGREELRELASFAEGAFTFSEFSAGDLRAAGFRRVLTVPYPIDFNAFESPPDPTLVAQLGDGATNVLFVGRGSPNKRIDALLRVFTAYQRLYDPGARLVIAGALDRDSAYGQWVHTVRRVLNPERVHILGKVSAAQLAACFSTASVYLSLSVHEGFGVPLVEAMHKGVPVVAFSAAAVPETLGGAGWAYRKDDPIAFAELLAVLRTHAATKEALVTAGRARARRFDVDQAITEIFEAISPDLTASSSGRPATASAGGAD